MEAYPSHRLSELRSLVRWYRGSLVLQLARVHSSTWKANQDCGEKFSALRIGNNVTRSENEAVLSNEKSCPSTFSSSFNANYSARESFTCLALAKRRLSYLCVRTDERYNKNNHETGDFQLIPPMQVVPLIPIDDRSILPPLRE